MGQKFNSGRDGQPRQHHGEEIIGHAENMDDLLASDAFLTDLSRGVDPSAGSDELASLLLGLRDEVEAPMPAAPELEGDACAEMATEETPVVSLADRRARRVSGRGGRHQLDTQKDEKRFRTSPWMAGLVGAAAATVMVAGTGAALYNATPGSALYGPSEAIFGERTDVVEFATALDEIDNKTQSGDIAGARVLIEQLRDSLKDDREQKRNERERDVVPAPQATDTVTVTKAPPKKDRPEDSRKPETVTVTPDPVTHTVTVTEAPQPTTGRETEPSSSPRATSTTPTIPTTTKSLGAPQPQADAQSSQ